MGGLVAQDIEKDEVLNAFFASAFTSKSNLQESQKQRGKAGERKMYYCWKIMRPGKLGIHKAMVSDRMHQQILRELSDVIVSPLSIIFN